MTFRARQFAGYINLETNNYLKTGFSTSFEYFNDLFSPENYKRYNNGIDANEIR